MLSKAEQDRLHKLSQSEKNSTIHDLAHKIHLATNSGTLDRDAINDAVERLQAITAEPPKPKFDGNPRPNVATGKLDQPQVPSQPVAQRPEP